ncbi:M20 aminoacylase family protein [Devosia sp. 63-57]|uniref:M20 aminoacylase family protein n=1 Tax=Devosia sp. 63-57 TaxID=1895751 RepID=UPI0008698D22|nr:M20 aminoacylase family protein [Devosia sp. 63-57]ODT48111.1 MAG: amidohydrolase [Pelagibacterium sp. SCN 63-126]ODU83220.1 MAG: amidohydrolase [Pelagibacterium sp. SCN 63-17]OJX42180.1 MAG: amidohydrolase [Devosia sp. 63-57]
MKLSASTHEQLTQWRRHLHAHPELGFEERTTSDFVAERLTEMGIAVTRNIGGTGLVGTLSAGTGNRSIGLRADMDALAIQEIPGRDHGSQNPGKMHACGHDGHTTMLLGAAQHLVAHPEFSGTVHFIFQPAEEHGRGALSMIEDGLFERFPMEEIYGIHNMPGIPVGQFATRPGPFMGAEDNFEIVVTGKGVHAARPHSGVDPIVAASAIVMGLQTIVSRRIDPTRPCVVSVTEFIINGTRNVIPSEVRIKGDCRSFLPEVSAAIETEMRRLADSIAAGYAASATVAYSREFVPTINAAETTEASVRVARRVLGEDAVDADCPLRMGSEDFAHMLARVPGTFVNLGNGAPGTPGATPLHNPGYDFNDEIIPLGVAYYTALVADRLPRGA